MQSLITVLESTKILWMDMSVINSKDNGISLKFWIDSAMFGKTGFVKLCLWFIITLKRQANIQSDHRCN